MKTSVLIVENQSKKRNSITNLVQSNSQLRPVQSVGTLEEACATLENQVVDVLLTDLDCPDCNGMELISFFVQRNIPTLVLSDYSDEKTVVNAINCGASGYMVKDEPREQIQKSIDDFIAGGVPLSASVSRYIIRNMNVPGNNEFNADGENKEPAILLTDRENDVMKMISKGYSYSEIASVLSLSIHTVGSHLKNIYRKLKVNSRGEAVFEALQLGLLS